MGRHKNKREAKSSFDTTPRMCLKCNERFESIGPGNRICDTCKRANRKEMSLPTSVCTVHRKSGNHKNE